LHKGKRPSLKGDDMMNFDNAGIVGKEMMDHGLKSSAAMVKGLQTIAAEATEYSKTSVEAGSAMLEKLFAAKSLDKAIEIQTAYAKDAWEAHVAEMTKLGELYTELAKEAFKPFEALAAKNA